MIKCNGIFLDMCFQDQRKNYILKQNGLAYSRAVALHYVYILGVLVYLPVSIPKRWAEHRIIVQKELDPFLDE
jgi:hypothetical protein